MPTTPDRLDRLLADIKAEFPRFRLVRKDESALQRAIHYALVGLTFGGMRRYLTDYQTTMGSTVYVTPDWGDIDRDERWVTMRHERVHMRQFRRYSRPGMALLYLLVPLPMGLAYFRARFERAAYEETIRAAAELHGIDHVRAAGFRERVIGQFTGASYGWMWPFRTDLERWYDSVLATLHRRN
ncbi:MAG TPA: hypothetical protein VL172_20325 [Kofleriaceae bacterium]|nr:hypothetical protein [Kofleriaceae bacterium]